ncbi:MAG: ATP-binding protein [Acidimicrobiales bacterium]
MTTENVAVLFTDVVSSTELSQQLSPEAADEVRRGHFSILRQALAETGGTEVKNLGDGLMVVFDSASAALACGVSMQQGVERDNRGRELAIGLRVGLSQGEVTREGDDYFGDPVIEAARLCATCAGGQVLAAHVVRLMAGRRNRHQCRTLGELRLKGLSDPVETVEVLWEPIRVMDSSISIPLPGRLAVRPTVGVVGRETETQAIADAHKRVLGEQVREALLISGEAGIGKTALVAEAARAAFEDGACVLFGHCEEDLATPYQLFAEALNHYVTHAPEDQFVTDVEEYGADLVRLAPALSRRFPELPLSKATDADTERFLLFTAVVRLLAKASEDRPVVLVLEDLQWADKGSLLLLRHLIAAEQAMRVLVIATYRDSELSRTHPLVETLAALHRQNGVSRIDMAGLDDTGVLSLMEAAAGQAMDDAGVALAHAVHNETDGNPFFVSEVLRHLSEIGAIYQDSAGRWTASGPPEQIALPESVRMVIGARVGRLGPAAEHVLSIAAVIGRDFDLEVLARATGNTEEELLDILDAAGAIALVRELANTAGRYIFAHALIQHTLYEDLGPTRRARAHRQVAEALEELCGERPGARVGELARHWFNATQPVDLMKAIDYSRQAADAALIGLAPDDALRYYSQALDICARVSDPDEELGLDLRIGLGTAQRQTGDPEFRDTLLGAARRAADIGDTDRLVAATLANDRGTFSTVDTIDAEKVEVLEIALDRLITERPERALLLAMLCSELTIGSPLDRRKDLADEAIAIAEDSGDDVTIVRVLNHVSLPLAVPSLLPWSSARTADALVRAQRIGDPLLLCSAASGRRFTAACSGDIVEMDRCFEIKTPLVEQLDQPFLTWVHTLQRATRALIAGDTDEAEKWAMEALQIGMDGGQPDAAVIFGAQFIMVSLWRGTLSDLIPMILQAIDDNPGLPVFVAALALAHSEADHAEESRQLLQGFATAGFDLPQDPTWLTGMIAYADAAVELHEPEFVGPMLECLSPFADQWLYTDVATYGPISRTLGGLATVLGRFSEAESYFSHSAAMSEGVGANFFAARSDLSWGRMLLERRGSGDLERARELLTRAQAAATTHGYGTVARRAASALADLD